MATTGSARANRLCPIGAPLLTAGGGVVAIYGGGGLAWPIREVLTQLTANLGRGRMPASIGVTLQPLSGALEQALGTGVVVTGVVARGPAAEAGIADGDVLVSLDGAAVNGNSAIGAVAQSTIGTAVTIAGRRNGRPITFKVIPRSWIDVSAAAHQDGLIAASQLFDARQLADARVPGAASVVAINGRPARTTGEARRLLSTRRSTRRSV